MKTFKHFNTFQMNHKKSHNNTFNTIWEMDFELMYYNNFILTCNKTGIRTSKSNEFNNKVTINS